jgi:glycosyltransferase involved in cell wall biosynthesis
MSINAPKSLQLIAPAPAGGAESVVLGLVEALRTSGHETSLAPLLEGTADHPFVHAARARGLAVCSVVGRRRRYLEQARLVAQTAHKEQAELIHTHGFTADVIGAVAGRIARLPVVSTLHGFSGEGLRMQVYDAAARWAHQRAAALVAVSSPIAERLRERGVRSDRIATITNALLPRDTPLSRDDARATLGVPGDGPRVGWVGRLSTEKGPDVLLEAWSRLERPEARLSVVGDGPMRAALAALADALQIASRVDWHGLVAEAGRVLPAFDVLVLSSRSEGTPMILLEAMASGTPIVATEVGGVPEMLSAHEAMLVPPEQPTALAEAIAAALGDSAASQSRAAVAQARLRREHSPAVWVERHAQLYATVVGRSATH